MPRQESQFQPMGWISCW